MNKTYSKGRGYHHWLCLVCGAQEREAIPDQAEDRYQHNPGNPILAVCGGCNRGSPSAGIRLGNSSLRPQPNLTEETQMPAFHGVWGEFWEIAKRFERKARAGDWQDLRHDIIVRLAEVAKEYQLEGKTLTEGGMIRVASYTTRRYWYQKVRWGRITSLNTTIEDEDGDSTELIDTIADDKAIHLEAWMDARTWLMGCPKRLIQIAHKRAMGIALTEGEQSYLLRWRRKEQKRLF